LTEKIGGYITWKAMIVMCLWNDCYQLQQMNYYQAVCGKYWQNSANFFEIYVWKSAYEWCDPVKEQYCGDTL